MIGKQIEKYKIISLLGEGGMANVYLASHETLGHKVAFKMLKEDFVQRPNIRKRFLAEAKNLAKIDHPNIIKVTDLIDAGDIVAFAMEYVEGDSLDEYLVKQGKLTEKEIKNLFDQMILSVDYIHGQGLIHRDIKPSNFMLSKNGEIKLLDFGIAKNTNENAVDYTKTGLTQQMGTPLYMSPEQVRGTSEVTKQTDIYSLGVVLWQMVMNKKPYDSGILSLPEMQVSILKEELPLSNTKWDEIIKNATQKDPNKRALKKIAQNDFEKTVFNENLPPINNQPKTGFFTLNNNILIGVVIIVLIGLIVYFFSGTKTNGNTENDGDANEKLNMENNEITEKKERETNGAILENQENEHIEKDKTEAESLAKDNLEPEKANLKIGQQIWMTKNLSVSNFRDGTKLFYAKSSSDWIESSKNKIPAYTIVTVRGEKQTLYNAHVIHSLKEIAPYGYHVPTIDDWVQLIDYCGGESVAGYNLTSKKFKGSDKFGFNAIPAGSYHVFHQKYNGIEEVSGGNRDYQGSSLWWTSETKIDDFDNSLRPYFISAKDGFIWWGTHFYGYGCSIRLIKN